MKPTFEEVAALLCKDEPTPNWVIEKLRENAELVGYLIKPTDDRSIERLLFESALHLQELLPLYPRAAKLTGEDYDPSIDDIDTPLHNLIEFLAKEVALPKRSGGPIEPAKTGRPTEGKWMWGDAYRKANGIGK
jgi:hypothetical protein